MTNNDTTNSIRSVARNIRIFEFLIEELVHEDIRYFPYKMNKG